ncbi:probable protein O-mannosyl-transferase TMTC4 [Coccomyxa sp. Obi]|nr:probable protein O-mannosyl-transferase TMTC4 [Coccomyxa sp. Obi]
MLVLACIGAASYFNTLQAGFTYDDFYAVINNRDVTNDDTPLFDLLLNDFWGYKISKPNSHKSYRPLTTLSLRLQRRYGNQILNRLGWRKVYRVQDSSDDDLDPFPFHVCNVAMHAAVTCLVYLLAMRLCNQRDAPLISGSWQHRHGDSPFGESGAGRQQGGWANRKGAARDGLRQRRSSSMSAEHTEPNSMRHNQSCGDEKGAAMVRHQAEAFLAGAIFAVHPIHTEAVASIVGQAELLSAAFSMGAIILYAQAADVGHWMCRRSGRQGECGWMRAGHWLLVAAALFCIWAASLAKEIGITVTATVVLYDAFLVPFDRVQQSPGRFGFADLAQRFWRQLQTRKAARILAAGLTLVCYVKLRSFLAVDQLVRMYRELDNPIAFAVGPTQLLSLAHLHAQYAWLMLAPARMCSDWSYACVPLVERVSDWRNLLSIVAYVWLARALLIGRPWEVIAEGLYGPREGHGQVRKAPPVLLCGSGLGMEAAQQSRHAVQQQVHQRQRQRWHCFVAVGLIVAPFLPASNLFFWVGTYIGERLLYTPSIGYCILMADLLAVLAGDSLPGILLLWRQSPGEGGNERQGRQRKTAGRKQLAAVLVAVLLGGYMWRTIDRNWDWEDEERLFRSALQVCPNGAKNHLNMGIVERRYRNWAAALHHFQQAQRLSSASFCEPLYWIGTTRIHSGRDVALGAQELEASLACPQTATKAATALAEVYSALHAAAPHGGYFLKRWARVLLRPELRHAEPACDALESALLDPEASAPAWEDIQATMQPCLDYLADPVNHTEPEAAEPLAALRGCIEARMTLLDALARNGPASLAGRAAAYGYIARFGNACRLQHLPPEHVRAEVRKARVEGLPLPQEPPPGAAPGHMALVSWLRTAAPGDAWLLREWGEILAAQRRFDEAAMHFEAAGKQLVKLMSGVNILGIDGENGRAGVLTLEQTAQAATAAFSQALQVGAAEPCHVWHQMCGMHAKLADALSARGQIAEAKERADAATSCLRTMASGSCHEHVQSIVDSRSHASTVPVLKPIN